VPRRGIVTARNRCAKMPPAMAGLATLASISRLHIVAIACLAALTFGWLMGGTWPWPALLFCAVDWFVCNLVNRVADLAEDQRNGIVGTAFVARHARGLAIGCLVLVLVSLAVGHAFYPGLLPWRIAFNAIAFAYSYRVLPWMRKTDAAWKLRLVRWKDLYFWKNFASSVLFLIATLAYPAVVLDVRPEPLWLLVIVGFFLPLELTYEVIYDLRDVPGDTQEGVPTFPVVHGAKWSHGLVRGLLALSGLSLVLGAVAGIVGLAEFVLIGGTIQQAVVFERAIAPDPTAARCIQLTWLGAAQIASYHVWIAVGLPVRWGG
jgi:4-hydroxybenzoate polyprenyltransferase